MTDANKLRQPVLARRLTCLLVVLTASGVPYAKPPEWLEELNRMEHQADQARKAFWCGRYAEAEQQFADLAGSVHPSVMLYLNECAMCELAQGRYQAAERRLRQVDSLLNTYYSAEREERAMSVFGAEGEKVYRGDPYEQAAAYLFLALILMDQGDYDNALAACKSGILADSDASENLFESDVALLHALEAKCHQLRGDEQAFQSHREAAAKSIRLTSGQIQEDFSRRLDLLELLKMSRSERARVGERRKDDEIRAEIQHLSDQLDRKTASINAAELLGPLYSGDFNVLVLVPRGRCVEKTRAGSDAEMIVFRQHDMPCEGPRLQLDADPLDAGRCLPAAVDLEFQATTRGGRRMDAILRGKAASRTTTRGVGQALTEAGGNVGGYVGLGVALVGGAVQGAAGSMTAEADTRCWQTLPKRYEIYAFTLPHGDHQISGAHYVYFQRMEEFRHEFALTDDRDIAVFVTPPPAHGLYFCPNELRLSKRDRTGLDNGSTVLIPPPTGLDHIIRVRTADGDAKPEAFAPDPKRIMRAIRKVLTTRQIPSALVSHAEVVQSRTQFADKHSRALQCHFIDLVRSGTRQATAYRAKLVFCLVDTKAGNILTSQTVEGTSAGASGGATTAFYTCLAGATEAFLQSPDLRTITSK